MLPQPSGDAETDDEGEADGDGEESADDDFLADFPDNTEVRHLLFSGYSIDEVDRNLSCSIHGFVLWITCDCSALLRL